MPTILQKRLAGEIIKNTKRAKPFNKRDLVVSGGYSKTVAIAKPEVILTQKGVLKELENYGFTEENAKKVVSEILLKSKREDMRLRASEQVFKVLGSYAPEKKLNVNVNSSLKELTESELEKLAYKEDSE